MSEMARKARSDMRAKARRLVDPGDPRKRVDSSSWTPPEQLEADKKTGARPIRPRIYKAGGKVQGDRTRRADRAARADGGKAVANAIVNRDVRAANKEEFGSYHDGGFKRGGRARRDMGGMADPREVAAGALNAAGNRSGVPVNRFTPASSTKSPLIGMKSGGRSHRAKGGKADSFWTYKAGSDTPTLEEAIQKKAIHPSTTQADWNKMSPGMQREIVRSAAKRPERASGGKVKKGKTNIVINIGTGKQQQPPTNPLMQAPMRPPAPPPMGLAPPGAPPPGMPPGGPPMGGPPPGMPPGGPPMPPPGMPRKSGGRAMHAGAGSGEGRLEKMKMQRGNRASGGKTDMNAGALSGQGRLEKIKLQAHNS